MLTNVETKWFLIATIQQVDAYELWNAVNDQEYPVVSCA